MICARTVLLTVLCETEPAPPKATPPPPLTTPPAPAIVTETMVASVSAPRSIPPPAVSTMPSAMRAPVFALTPLTATEAPNEAPRPPLVAMAAFSPPATATITARSSAARRISPPAAA